ERYYVCGRRGAAIACCNPRCEWRFYLPGAVRARCLMQYYGRYSTTHLAHPFALPHKEYCSHHCLRQAMVRDPEPGTECLLCLEALSQRKSFRIMGSPACQHVWFHGSCVQGHALCAGSSAFQCMLYRDKEDFRAEMLFMDICIPVR
ncbi:G2E3 ligase, partial [Semnornis frantzii]|nr:G2E3 ligase [Semnornis frantzii]